MVSQEVNQTLRDLVTETERVGVDFWCYSAQLQNEDKDRVYFCVIDGEGDRRSEGSALSFELACRYALANFQKLNGEPDGQEEEIPH